MYVDFSVNDRKAQRKIQTFAPFVARASRCGLVTQTLKKSEPRRQLLLPGEQQLPYSLENLVAGTIVLSQQRLV